MADATQYHLVVSAGPSYDTSTHRLVPVNKPEPLTISTPDIQANLNVRIQNYRGLPTGSPATAPYFSNAPHTADLYSIEFSFVLPGGSSGDGSAGESGKEGERADENNDGGEGDEEEVEDTDTARPDGIPGTDLVFGNDFANPIRDRLPPGFDTAFRIVRWAIDPGLDGDVKADKPYLYGPLLSSINVLRIGDKVDAGSGLESAAGEDDDAALQEGADGSGAAVREGLHIPEQGAKRMKHFLNADRRGEFTFERGRVYRCDFFNPYLDFNDLALRLPGISLHLMRFWDGQPLRYVLKHKTADGRIDKPLMVIVFALVPADEIEEEEARWRGKSGGGDGESKEASGAAKSGAAKEGGEGGAAKKQDYVDDDVD